MFAALVLALAGSAALVTSVFVGGNCERKRERVEQRTMRCGDGPRGHHEGKRARKPDPERTCRRAVHDLERMRLSLGADSAAYLERRDLVLKACIVK